MLPLRSPAIAPVALLIAAAALTFVLASSLNGATVPTKGRSGSVSSPAWSLGTSTSGGSALMGSPYAQEDDEDHGIADFFFSGMVLFVAFLSPLVGGLLALCAEPRKPRDIHEHSRLERPG
jgi:hypothetical protein